MKTTIIIKEQNGTILSDYFEFVALFITVVILVIEKLNRIFKIPNTQYVKFKHIHTSCDNQYIIYGILH